MSEKGFVLAMEVEIPPRLKPGIDPFQTMFAPAVRVTTKTLSDKDEKEDQWFIYFTWIGPKGDPIGADIHCFGPIPSKEAAEGLAKNLLKEMEKHLEQMPYLQKGNVQ